MDRQEIERSLIPRLKKMGILLFLFSLCAVAYPFLAKEPIEEEILLAQFDDPPPLNPFVVSVAFATIGATCVTIAWKKQKS